MNFYKHPAIYSTLRNLYWQLRAVRAFDHAARRKWYRRIRVERDLLVASGCSAEHVRLYCRWMKSPDDAARENRLRVYEAMVLDFARIQAAARYTCSQTTIEQ